jgi:Flp pilus assembly protein TadD
MAQLEPDSARVDELRGDRMAEIGNMQGAILAYRKAIERDPHLSSVHLALGDALSISRDAGERAQAESEYKKELADNPYDEKAECRLGDIEMQRSNFDAAEQHYKRALQLQPDDPDANEGLGIVLFEDGQVQEARTYLNHAVQLDPANAAAYYHLSQASRRAGDFDQANREMDQFLKLKAQDESLKRSFDDLPFPAARQAREAQENRAAPASLSTGSTSNPEATH